MSPYPNIAKTVSKVMVKMGKSITIDGTVYACLASDSQVMREIDEDGGSKVMRVLDTDILQADLITVPAVGTKCTFNGTEYRIPQGSTSESLGSVFRITWEAL